MYYKYFIIILPVILLPVTLFGQEKAPYHHTPAETLFHHIDRAYHQGELTLDQAILQKFYVVFEPEKVLSAFLPEDGKIVVRCLTPLIVEYERNKNNLSPATRSELESYTQNVCSQPETQFSYTSESGRFIIYYDTDDSPHAVPEQTTNENGIPNYILRTEFAMDSTWNHLVGALGFQDPVINENTPYEIRYRNFSIGTYGYTCRDFDTANTFIVLHNNFEDFIDNNHPEGNQMGALYSTSAHEFKHASQFATNRWRGEAGEVSWTEMDATMIEDIIFGDVNDNIQFLRAGDNPAIPAPSTLFGYPEIPVPVAYNHYTWKLYFAEKLGMEFWVDVWNRFKPEPEKPFIEAMRNSLENYDSTFEQQHIENLAWHIASGPSVGVSGYGFERKDLYPDPNFNWMFYNLPDSSLSPNFLQPLAANFILVQPALFETGNLKITTEFDRAGAHLGLIGFFRDGSVQLLTNNQGEKLSVIEPRWLWEDMDRLGIVVVNLDDENDEAIRYTIRAESTTPDQITLFQNYPNPFNPSTNIQFYNDRTQRVRIDVYDMLGRHIRTLTDREYQQGHHDLNFEASDLASGVYVYRITGGNQRVSKKMMIIK